MDDSVGYAEGLDADMKAEPKAIMPKAKRKDLVVLGLWSLWAYRPCLPVINLWI